MRHPMWQATLRAKRNKLMHLKTSFVWRMSRSLSQTRTSRVVVCKLVELVFNIILCIQWNITNLLIQYVSVSIASDTEWESTHLWYLQMFHGWLVATQVITHTIFFPVGNNHSIKVCFDKYTGTYFQKFATQIVVCIKTLKLSTRNIHYKLHITYSLCIKLKCPIKSYKKKNIYSIHQLWPQFYKSNSKLHKINKPTYTLF